MFALLDRLSRQDMVVCASGGSLAHGAAENSLPALEAAIDGGLDLAAIDVRMCRDGVLVAFRDPTLMRTTAAQGLVSALSSEALMRLQLRGGRGGEAARLTSAYVPLLSEIFATAKDRIALTLRLCRWADAEAVAEHIASARMAGQVMMQVPLASSAQAARALALREGYGVRVCPVVTLKPETADAQTDLILSLEAPLVVLRDDGALRFAAQRGKLDGAGTRVMVSTTGSGVAGIGADALAQADPDQVWGHLVDAGITAIQTGYAEGLSHWLRERVAA